MQTGDGAFAEEEIFKEGVTSTKTTMVKTSPRMITLHNGDR